MSANQVQVGVIGPARGLRGEVLVRPTTDDPDGRFAPGSVLVCEGGRALTVAGTRVISNRLCVTFEGVCTREEAEALRGAALLAQAEADEEGFYASDLVGLRAETPDGAALGCVSGFKQGPAQDLLTVATEAGEVLVPFVEAIVPEVDLVGRRVVITPPDGLFGQVEGA